jgi:iron complex transport system substrate-binding protein
MPNRTAIPAALAALAATCALAACGADGGEEGGSAVVEADADAFPVTIEHKFGTTEIDAPPRRVVSVGYTEQDTVLALGVEPVGIREFIGGYDYRDRPWAEDVEPAEEPAIVGGEEISFERVAAARPDLIIGLNSGMTEGDYERLSQFAPTIAQTDEFIDFGMPWRDQVLTIGRALGREDRAEEIVDEIDADFARAREDHPEFQGASLVLGYRGDSGGFGAYASQDTRVRFFEELGFESPREIDELAGDKFFVDFDEEQLELLDQDVAVMFGSRDDASDHAVFGRLDAAREERVVYIDLEDEFSGALGFSSPLSIPFLLDEALPQLEAAVDGDPGTTEPEPK